MNKKELSQLRYLNKEIELLKQQIEQAEHIVEKKYAADYVLGSNPVWPYQKRVFHIEGIAIPEYEKRVKHLRIKLQKRLKILVKKQEQLVEYINNIDDSLIRQIMILRYINGLSWKQIANHIGGGNTPDSVRMLHNRFLRDN